MDKLPVRYMRYVQIYSFCEQLRIAVHRMDRVRWYAYSGRRAELLKQVAEKGFIVYEHEGSSWWTAMDRQWIATME